MGNTSGSAFLRNATGLVREFSWFDAFVISIAAATPSIYTFSSQTLFIVTADPGADVVTSTLLGFLFSIPLAVTYFLMASAIPRSGGDYIWVSRFLNPTVGFMAAWAFWIASVAVVGIISFLEGSVVIPITLASFGYSFHMSSLVSLASTIASPADVFVIGMAMIIVASAIAASGPRSVSRTMILLFGLTSLGTLVCFYVLATSSHTDFVNALNGFGGTNASYIGIMNAAKSSGWSYVPIASGATIVSIPLSVLLFAGFNYSVGASGEMKNARKSMFAGTIGALLFALIINIVGVQLGVNLVSYPFLQASVAVGSSWPFVAPPWIPFFVAMLIHNPLLLVLMNVGWLVGLLWGATGILLVMTRYVFAFSFDRAFPVLFADINPKFNFPLKATILNFVVAAIFVALASFTSFIGLFLNSVALYTIMWALGSAAAIVLPFKRKDLATAIPGSSGRVPLLSVLGTVSMLLMVTSLYFNVTTPAVGPSTPEADAILATIFVVGLVVYLSRYFYFKARGLDINRGYAEIPPE